MTRYYFAARYSRHPEMRELRDRIEREVQYAVVVSRWFDAGQPEQDFTAAALNANPGEAWVYAMADLDDLASADVLVCFTYGGGGRGGRHVEFGYFLGLRGSRRIVIVGPREHIFHCYPAAEVFDDFDAFLAAEVVA